MKRIVPNKHSTVPAVEKGWFEISYAILASRELARLEGTFDIVTTISEHRRRTLAGENLGPWPRPPIGTRNQIQIFDGHAVIEGPQFEHFALFPTFDRLSSGSWIVTDGRLFSSQTTNAKLIAKDGKVLLDLNLGDAVLHLQSDAEGGFWVGYFDEGIFGNSLGVAGINRFDASGKVTFPVGEPFHSGWSLPQISDCDALNVTSEAVWICPYTDYPITRIGFDGNVRTWSNDKYDASLLAVESDLVVLLGGYGEERNRGALLRLEENSARKIAEFEIDLDIDDFQRLPYAGAREDTFHFVRDHDWLQLPVRDIATALL
jgi:hypothetical protein